MVPSGESLDWLMGEGMCITPVMNGPHKSKGAVLTMPSLKPGRVATLQGSKLVFPGLTELDVPGSKIVGRMLSIFKEDGKPGVDVYHEGDCVSVTLSVDSDDDRVRRDIVCGVASAFVGALGSPIVDDEERVSEAHVLVYQVSGCGGFGQVYANPLSMLSAERRLLQAKLKESRKHRAEARSLELREHAKAAKETCASLCGLIAIAVDCEMVRGKDGRSMLARMSLVGVHHDDPDPQRRVVLLDVYVKPEGEVRDYLTHVSGIARHHIEGNPDALPFRLAREIFLDVVAQDRSLLLVGHGLVNDLAALCVGYEELKCEVADSATDPTCLRDSGQADSLRNLCQVHLQKPIQANGVHCSVEDAWAALCLRFKLVELEHEIGERGKSHLILYDSDENEQEYLLLLAASLECMSEP